MQNPIGVSTYTLREKLPPALQESLPTAEQLELELETAIQKIEAQDTKNPDSSE